MNIRRQKGLTTVEFAIIGTAVMLVLFGVIEIGRAMFVLNALGESTRRAARMATVCPVDDPAIAEVALFNAPGGGTSPRIVAGLSPANIAIDYLADDGTVLPNPASDTVQVQFVRARIVGFQHQMLIPFATYLFTTPDFATILPRESLGELRDGTTAAC
jgi:Flp pilus assembly protein TadG